MKLEHKIKKGLGKFFLAVEDLNDDELAEMRYNTCKACTKYIEETDQCGVCRCYMSVKTELKTNRDPELNGKIVETHCPLGKWNDKELADYYNSLKL